MIIERGVNLKVATKENWYPIHIALRNSKPEIQKMIIERGVNLEVANDDKWYPIHYVLIYSTPEIQKMIIERINILNTKISINKEYVGDKINKEIMKYLNKNEKRYEQMYLPIHMALIINEEEIIELILLRMKEIEKEDLSLIIDINQEYSSERIRNIIKEKYM